MIIFAGSAPPEFALLFMGDDGPENFAAQPEQIKGAEIAKLR